MTHNTTTAFRVCCPKCGSTNVGLETEKTHYFGAGPDGSQLHCFTCGKIVYGKEKIEAVAARQYAAWTQSERERRAAAEAEEAASRAAEAERQAARAQREAKRRADAARAASVRAADRAALAPRPTLEHVAMSCTLGSCPVIIWVTPDKKLEIRNTTKRIFCCPGHETEWKSLTKSDQHTCAWRACEEAARKNSLYCSRDCSNKNARWRLRLRKAATHPRNHQGV